jgi:ABC-type Mn2+/Zn2+ transport system permease subunit
MLSNVFLLVALARLLGIVGMVAFLIPWIAAMPSRRRLTRLEWYVSTFGLVISVIGFVLSGGHVRGPPLP